MSDRSKNLLSFEVADLPDKLKWAVAAWSFFSRYRYLFKRPIVLLFLLVLSAICIAIGFISCSIIDKFYIKIKDERIAQLNEALGLPKNLDARHKTVTMASLKLGRSFKTDYLDNRTQELWLRVKLENDTGAKASCKLWMMSLFNESTGNYVLPPGGVPAQLQLADSGASMDWVQLNDLPLDYDVAFIDSKEILTPATSMRWQKDLYPRRLSIGTYILTLEASGENCTSKPTIFRISYRGKYDVDMYAVEN